MRAIVTGISGQDGHFMTKLLVRNGYSVLGLTSDPGKLDLVRREFDGEAVRVEPFDFAVPGAITKVIERDNPQLFFNFAAKATGVGMFDEAFQMARLNGGFVLDVLEAIHNINPSIGFCQASSAEMYGEVDVSPQNERTSFRPKSPYGAAKLYAHNLVGIYRSAFGLRCSSAILFNHESTRRSTAFVTRKIARGAAAIKLGLHDELRLGSIDALRDWGYAPEYVEAIFRMATRSQPQDYVVATGKLTSVEEVCEICFRLVGLDYRQYIKLDSSLTRSIKTTNVRGDPAAIERDLGWKAKVGVESILAEMVECDLAALSRSPELLHTHS